MADLGFQLHRLELPVVTRAGTVVIDVLAVRAGDNPTILACEGKSGNNIEEQQARRYAELTTSDLRRLTPVPDAPLRIVYVCFEESVGRIRMGLEEAGLAASVIAVGPARIQMYPAPGAEDIQFDVAVPNVAPPRYIPVDPDSPDDEYRELLIPAVVAFAARSAERVSVGTLLEHAIPMWTHFPGGNVGRPREQAATRVHQRAVAVLRALGETHEFRQFFALEPRGRDMEDVIIRILRSPASYAPQGETQGWEAIRRRAERTLRGRVRRVPPGQLSFEDLAREEGVGKEE